MKLLSMKKTFAIPLAAFLICQTAYASPWAEKKSYGEKTAGKFLFGLKNATLGWTEIFTEPQEHKYQLQRAEWEGLCNGISKSVFYTANGLIHLATFPIPVDFPDMGEGTLPSLGKKGPPKPQETNGTEDANAAQIAAIEAVATAQPPLQATEAVISQEKVLQEAQVPVTPAPSVVQTPSTASRTSSPIPGITDVPPETA